MRSPGVIYRQYRQLKRRILFDKIVEARRQLHCNCLYGVRLSSYDEDGVRRTVRLCAFQCHRDVNTAKKDHKTSLNDVLKDQELCVRSEECNAFVNKRGKDVRDVVVKELEEELKNPEMKNRLYPDLGAFEWVLDKNLFDASKSPSWIVRMIVSLIEFLENRLRSSREIKNAAQ